LTYREVVRTLFCLLDLQSLAAAWFGTQMDGGTDVGKREQVLAVVTRMGRHGGEGRWRERTRVVCMCM
jgi:hypothetical protein